MPAIRVYTSTGWQDLAMQGPAGATPAINPYWTGQTWGISGPLSNGMVIPVIFVPERTNQSVSIVGARAILASGVSVGVQLQRNGVNLGGVATVTTTAQQVSIPLTALSDGDRLGLVISAASGGPSDMSYTVVLEHTST